MTATRFRYAVFARILREHGIKYMLCRATGGGVSHYTMELLFGTRRFAEVFPRRPPTNCATS